MLMSLIAVAVLAATASAAVERRYKLPPLKMKVLDSWIASADWGTVRVRAAEARAINPAADGRHVKVAVLDTGCDINHPMLKANIKGTYNAITKKPDVRDGHSHGTHVAGTVVSVAPAVELFIVKVLDDDGSGSLGEIAEGVRYAREVMGVDIVSMSLGGGFDANDPIKGEIAKNTAAGVLTICAAGNDGPGDTEGYPARYAEAISVAASDKDDRIAPFSSWGPNVFTTNPGADIVSAIPGGRQGMMSGTSMACPHESGKAAAWIACSTEINKKSRPTEYRKQVIEASPFKQRSNSRGYGLYTLDKIVKPATTQPQPPAPQPQPPAPPSGSFSGTVTYTYVNGVLTSVQVTARPGESPTPAPAAPPAVEQIPAASLPTWSQQPQQLYQPGCPGGFCPTGGVIPGFAPLAPSFQPFGCRFRR
jgi:hypothetical protein